LAGFKELEFLSEEELQDFRAALDRPRGVAFINVGPRETPRISVERKLDPPSQITRWRASGVASG